jgi:uncharacterized membrane protein
MDEAMLTLCSTLKTFVGFLVMLVLILGALLHAFNAVLNEKKPEAKRKSLLGKAGNVFLILCMLLLVLYLVIPFILPEQCSPKVPPYCGSDYCKSIDMTDSQPSNCTCIQY